MSDYANVHSNVRQMFREKLWSVSGIPDEQHRSMEGRQYTPTNGEPWIRESLVLQGLRARSLGASLLANVSHSAEGVYFIDFFYPMDEGTATPDSIVGAVADAFKPGTVLSKVGVNYKVVVSHLNGGNPPSVFQEVWYRRSVTVSWYSNIVI